MGSRNLKALTMWMIYSMPKAVYKSEIQNLKSSEN